MTHENQPGKLMVLSDGECWDRLRSRPVGRIAWAGAHGVSVIPVNYAVADETILIRTTPYSELARDCVDREVAFQVDVLDEEEHGGWSVLARGRCERLDRLPDDAPDPWATGPRWLGLRIEVREVSGRLVVPPVSSSAEGS